MWAFLVSTAAAQPVSVDGVPAADAPPTAASALTAPEPSVVVLLPDEVHEAWGAALEYELGLRSTRVRLEEPRRAPETSLVGDATAQLAARRLGAPAALWVQRAEGAFELRLVLSASTRAHVVRVAVDTDARSVALIVASLLDLGDAPAPPVLEVSLTPASDAPSPAAEQAADDAPEPPPGPHVRWSGRVGLSSFALTNTVTRFQPGLGIRAGMGMRYDGFELALMHDLGFYFPLDNLGGDALPMGRACVEAGGATRRTDAAFHAGGRGCAGSVVVAETVVTFPEVFASEGPRTHLSGGAYLAVSFRIEEWIRLFVRADLELGWTQLTEFDRIEFVPTLSTYVSFT